MSKRIAIIGSGPIGLEAALYARTLGHEVTVFERGRIATNVAAWGHVRLFSTWGMNTTPIGRGALVNGDGHLPLDQCPTGHELRDRYLLPLARGHMLKDAIREGVEVSSPEQIGDADVVLDCTGASHHHRYSGRDGKPAAGEPALEDRIFYTIPDILTAQREQFLGRHTLLLGYNYLAAMALRDLRQLAQRDLRTTVTWAVRHPGQAVHPAMNDPLPARARLLEEMFDLIERRPGWLQVLTIAAMESVSAAARGFTVALRCNGRLVCLAADQIISLTGPLTSNGNGRSFRLPTASFFSLGVAAMDPRRELSFALATGHRQVRDVFAAIEGQPDLDMYRPDGCD